MNTPVARDLRSMLEREEGREHEAYPDPLTGGAPWTIGVGHTGPEVHEGLVWTDAQIDAALDVDILRAERICNTLPWFGTLDPVRQAVLIGMAFQMGHGLMDFHHALASIGGERWLDAKEALLDSAWARQTPDRAERMADQIETGQWA